MINIANLKEFYFKIKGLFYESRGEIYYIGGNDILPPPLEGEEEAMCIKNVIEKNDQDSRAKLIEHNLRLVVYIAKKFDNTGVGVEDLISIGSIELLLSDILGTEEDVIYKDIENEVEKKLLYKAIEKLNQRERVIVEMRYGLNNVNGEEMTQKEVADSLGISQSYISRLEKKIIQRLKREIVKYE